MKRILIFFVFFLTACTTGPLLSLDPEFTALFVDAQNQAVPDKKHHTVVGFEEYVLQCCSTEEQVIRLLKRNGFRVETTDVADLSDSFKKDSKEPLKSLLPSLDKSIFASRKLTKPFAPVYYRARIFTKDGKVMLAVAYVYKDFFLP